MVDLAPIFLRNSAAGLVAEKPASTGLRGWITQGNYGVAAGSLGEVVLTSVNAAEFFPHLLFDYIRFAMASKESIYLSFQKPFDKRATAWALINRYYSAFFSAHALLRSHGKGITWIDANEAVHLEKLGKLYVGPNFTMKRGGYAFAFNIGNGFNSELRLAPVSYGGGSHDDFWRYFLQYLSAFGSDLLRSGAPLASQTTARFIELRRIIVGPASRGMWLSFMRNEINYQHGYGTWFPFKPVTSGATHDKRVLQQRNSSIDLTADAATHPLSAFNAVTCCMASINSDLATLIKERAGVGATRFRAEWNRLYASLEA
jgi:hypothetical protein